MDRIFRVFARCNFMAVPGGYDDTHWMKFYGGVPSDAQIDGYLANQAGASTAQKTLVTNAHKSGPVPHSMTIGKIKDILTNNT